MPLWEKVSKQTGKKGKEAEAVVGSLNHEKKSGERREERKGSRNKVFPAGEK